MEIAISLFEKLLKVGISHQIVHDKLEMRRINGKILQRLLTDEQKHTYVEISQELLATAGDN